METIRSFFKGLIPGHKANGGLIIGPGGPREDKVPTMLSPGEFVVRAHAAQKIGYQTLDHMNKIGTIPSFADGMDKDTWKQMSMSDYHYPERAISTITGKPVPTDEERFKSIMKK